MRNILIFISLFTIFSCSDKPDEVKTKVIKDNLWKYPNISFIQADFPLELDKINLLNSQNHIEICKKKIDMIEEVIENYYFNECCGDSGETYFKLKDTYIGTVELKDSLYSIYYVILKHKPTGNLNCKVIFYNNLKRVNIDEIIDHNIHAMYNLENERLKSSELKENFKIAGPDIELLDFNNDGINDFKFSRLYHNGTANALETLILDISKEKVDTLKFEQNWID